MKNMLKSVLTSKKARKMTAKQAMVKGVVTESMAIWF